MGKAEILANLGDGLYQARITYNTTLPAARKAALEVSIPALEQKITAATTARQTAEANVATAQAELTLLIEQLIAATPETAPAIRASITEKTAAARPLEDILTSARREESSLNLELSQITTEIARLDALLTAEDIRSIWCADYSTVLSGQVDTIEINGEPGQILIAPGGSGEPPALLAGVEAMSTANWARNFALHPYWQKYRPTYRTGMILSKSEDTCTVSLDQALSSYQGLDINQPVILSGVPIQYLDCNGWVFVIGDMVVVRFAGQDWSNPAVIGFADWPKPCDNYCPGAEDGYAPGELYIVPMQGAYFRTSPDLELYKAVAIQANAYPYTKAINLVTGQQLLLSLGTSRFFSIAPCTFSPSTWPYDPAGTAFGPGSFLNSIGSLLISHELYGQFRHPFFTWALEWGSYSSETNTMVGVKMGPFDEVLCGVQFEDPTHGYFEIVGISEDTIDGVSYNLLIRKIP